MPFPEDINDFSFSIPSFSGEDLEGIFEDQFVNFSYEEDPLEFDEDADWTSQAKTSLPFPSGNSNNLVDAAPEKVQSASTAGSEQNDSLVSLQSAARTAAKAARRRKHKFVPKRLTPLPDNFEPTNYSILCGQGKQSYNSIGNRRFRITASLFLKKYLKASTHKAKSDVVSEVLGIIYESCPVGAFIKYQNGRWYEVDKRTSREKVGAYFRDCCADQYKSSAKNKAARRRQKKEAERRMEADGCSFVSASTTTTTEPTETSSSVPSDFSY